MVRAFTQYWTADTVAMQDDASEDRTFTHTACNEFVTRGVEPGDLIYLVSLEDGKMVILSRGEVARIVTHSEAERILKNDDLWDAADHALIAPGTGLPFGKSKVGDDVASGLRFLLKNGSESALKYRENGRLDGQTLRTVRQLTPESAAQLDAVLEADYPLHADNAKSSGTMAPRSNTAAADEVTDEDANDFPEGAARYRLHRSYERSSVLIAEVKRARKATGKFTCDVCDFDFADWYGEIGEGFIEAHHCIPVSKLGKDGSTNPRDIALVCSNCHRMLHRRRPWLQIHELKKLLK
jgi:hypothetical protein